MSTWAQPQAQPLPTRDFVSVQDFTPEEIQNLFSLASAMKARPGDFRGALTGKQMVLFFEKPSLRTRLTFEAGMNSLGGSSFFFDQTNDRLGVRETLHDFSHNLERWVDILVLRTFDHATIEEIAVHADIPVINALSDFEHPCQALADFFTLQEHLGDLSKIRLAYVGDGNNMAHSLMLAGAAVGAKISIATPPGYEPAPSVVDAAQALAAQTGAKILLGHDPKKATKGADAVYTDVWTSMGSEGESETRSRIFAPYQINSDLMRHAAPNALFMHCLPAHRGSEVIGDVIDSPQSIVFDQAENRLHIQKAILTWLLGGGVGRFPVRSAHA